jgi:hypothetical protein
LAAQRQLKEGRGRAAFLRGKIASVCFYAMNRLPQAAGLAEVAIHGGAAVMKEAAF